MLFKFMRELMKTESGEKAEFLSSKAMEFFETGHWLTEATTGAGTLRASQQSKRESSTTVFRGAATAGRYRSTKGLRAVQQHKSNLRYKGAYVFNRSATGILNS